MITVTRQVRRDGAWHLELRGHAAAGPYGADLVCAGASALAWAGERSLRELFDRGYLACPPECRMESGWIRLGAVPGPGGRVRTRQVLDTLLAGLGRLEELHPACIVIENPEGGIRNEELGMRN